MRAVRCLYSSFGRGASSSTVVLRRQQQHAAPASVLVPANFNTSRMASSSSSFFSAKLDQENSVGLSSASPVPPPTPAISSVSSSSESITVEWADSSSSVFPHVWLRDNCQCAACFHPVSLGRMFLFADLDVDVKARDARLCDETGEVVLTWPDGHVSRFCPSWLRDRSDFGENPAFKKRIGRASKAAPVLFGGGDGNDVIKKHDFDKVMDEDESLLKWLKDLEVHGLTLLSGMDGGDASLPALINRVGFPKRTHYGSFFHVESKADPSNLAYTAGTLGLHVDHVFYDYAPGIQFLHCVSQFEMEGGDNEFSDGFAVADALRRDHPAEWSVLTRVPVTFFDVGAEPEAGRFNKVHQAPTIQLGANGIDPVKITFSNQHRDSFMSVAAPEEVKPFYRALSLFNRLAYSPAHLVRHKLEDGDCVVFDNTRVLHGRKGFRAAEGYRKLVGGYMDWDEVISKINVLEDDF